ncbi:hypothetical protein B0H14DRAFT_1503828 [Mycena olivaceomarginata]|nr:hypothetical protein B0H14DRAFT_1503828 [Mycena olivaceomarginata]
MPRTASPNCASSTGPEKRSPFCPCSVNGRHLKTWPSYRSLNRARIYRSLNFFRFRSSSLSHTRSELRLAARNGSTHCPQAGYDMCGHSYPLIGRVCSWTTTWTLISTHSSRHTPPSTTCRLFWGVNPCATMLCPSSEHSPGVPTIFSSVGRAAERGRAVVAALTKTPNLRRLAIVNGYEAVYDPRSESDGNGIYMLGVDHSTICAIAQACSGITHLELHLKSAVSCSTSILH